MDGMHDYEYYEARAKDVKLEDITSDDDNAEILAWLRDNDPETTYIYISASDDYGDFVVREGDHLGWLGYFVGRSEMLETLHIDNDNNHGENINLNAFFEGLRHNRSIEELKISSDLGEEGFQSLIPFLRNNGNLRELCFNYFDIGLQCARNISLLLRQNSSLKRLVFDENGLDDEKLVEIVAALRAYTQLEELKLTRNYNLGRDGFVALGKALEGCLNLMKLDLTDNNNDIDDGGIIDDEGLHALVEGLKFCRNLTSLLLGNLMITEEGLRSLSTLFQSDSCRLERLYLDQMNIDEDGAAVLATGLASLPSLKRLDLRGTSIGDRGLQDLVRGLVNCNLEELNLSGNTLMDSVSGIKSLGKLVAQTTNMRSLFLSNSSLTDEGLQSFVEGMANCCSLTQLYLSYNRSITANGLESLSSLFQAELCSMRTLELCGIHLGDDGAAALANGLIGNKSLQTLKLNVSSITARGWAAFSRLLCDTSSVNNTYLSNHTLQQIGGYGTPSDVVKYLKLNETDNQAAAICKILLIHPDIDVTPLFQFNLMCLPLVVEWFEKAKPYMIGRVNVPTRCGEIWIRKIERRQLLAAYKFIRGMPLLAANGLPQPEEGERCPVAVGVKSEEEET